MGIVIKFADLVSQYDGSGEFSEWIQKLELVAKLQKVDELHVVLPLFLSGGAFAVYQGLSDEIEEDYKEVKNALTTAFSTSPLTAYEEFINRRLKENESVDVYLAELTRLSKLISSHVSEEWIRCAFILGLPDEARKQLQTACSISTMSLYQIAEKSRSLVILRRKESCFVSCVNPVAISLRQVPQGRGKKTITCYRCGEDGHISRNCSEEIDKKRCFVCGMDNHLALHYYKKCTNSKNMEGEPPIFVRAASHKI